jgi:hypothetical protein
LEGRLIERGVEAEEHPVGALGHGFLETSRRERKNSLRQIASQTKNQVK